jgi:hypothetical protein
MVSHQKFEGIRGSNQVNSSNIRGAKTQNTLKRSLTTERDESIRVLARQWQLMGLPHLGGGRVPLRMLMGVSDPTICYLLDFLTNGASLWEELTVIMIGNSIRM